MIKGVTCLVIFTRFIHWIDGVEMSETLARIVQEFFGPHTDTVVHWPPLSTFEIWVRLKGSSFDLRKYAFVSYFVVESHGFMDKHNSDLLRVHRTLTQLQQQGLDMKKIVLDIVYFC
jgi:hypothetical protein